MPTKSLPPFISSSVRESHYFFLDLRPAPNVKLAVVCGGREKCDPHYLVDRSHFPYFALELVAQGQGAFQGGDVEYPLRAGSVFAYRPDLPHRLTSSPASPMVKYFVDFTGSGAESLLIQAGLTAGVPRQLVQSRWLQSLFDQLLETGNHPGNLARHHCRLLLKTMISRVRIDARDARQLESAAYETYARCRHHAEQDYLALSTAGEWAEACYVDRAYLSRLFKRFANQKPYQFLLQLKIDHSADLLVRRNVSVKQAAHIVGFDDPQHFSRVFKRVRGYSPSNFLQLVTRHLARQLPTSGRRETAGPPPADAAGDQRPGR